MGNIFEIKDDFYMNGEPFKIISGAFHYFRTVPEYWQDRLEKLIALGCNTVETYIPWNMHEKEKGSFSFEGILDIERFIKLAGGLGLYVILRPSPYICAEWEFGGLPAWLLKEDGMRLRADYGPYLKAVREYYDVLIPMLAKHQITKGGPVIMMQVENEYGYYGTDSRYLDILAGYMRERGIEVPFVTSDGPYTEALRGGLCNGAVQTGNFGSRTEERFAALRQAVGNRPLMCTEFWVGWFDHWGNGGHMRGKLEENVADFDKMLEMGSANIYMFEGGTNFGFMNGSNYYDELTPDVTSYDYDALLTEDGRITEKYRRFKEVIAKYRQIPEVELSTRIERRAYGTLQCGKKVSLFNTLDRLSKKVHSSFTQSMEKLDQYYGYILYSSRLRTEENIDTIRLWGANDRANIFVGEEPQAVLYDRELLAPLELQLKGVNGKKLDILVENMGRVNFGPLMEIQHKGIKQCVQINGHIHNDWDMYTLPLDNVDSIDFEGGYTEGTPAFYSFSFDVSEKGDTFLDFGGWGKGCVFLNGFNLGRFWEKGPQRRLYIPAPLLKEGRNEIIVFETDGKASDTIVLADEPDIG